MYGATPAPDDEQTHVDVWRGLLYTLSYNGGNHTPVEGDTAWWVPQSSTDCEGSMMSMVFGYGGVLAGDPPSNNITITGLDSDYVLCLHEEVTPGQGRVNVLHSHVTLRVYHEPPSAPPPPRAPPPPPPPASPPFNYFQCFGVRGGGMEASYAPAGAGSQSWGYGFTLHPSYWYAASGFVHFADQRDAGHACRWWPHIGDDVASKIVSYPSTTEATILASHGASWSCGGILTDHLTFGSATPTYYLLYKQTYGLGSSHSGRRLDHVVPSEGDHVEPTDVVTGLETETLLLAPGLGLSGPTLNNQVPAWPVNGPCAVGGTAYGHYPPPSAPTAGGGYG